MVRKFIVTYNVCLFCEHLLDLHFLTETLEDIEKQVDDHFRECYPLVYDAVIKKCEDFPYTFKIYELLPIYCYEQFRFVKQP